MPLPGRGPGPVWLCEQQLGLIVKLSQSSPDSAESRLSRVQAAADGAVRLLSGLFIADGRKEFLNKFLHVHHFLCDNTNTVSRSGARGRARKLQTKIIIVNETGIEKKILVY